MGNVLLIVTAVKELIVALLPTFLKQKCQKKPK